MKRTKAKTTVTVGGAILVALATVVKLHFFPTIKDAYFEPGFGKLQRLPANLLVLRPTHFPHASTEIRHTHNGDSLSRTLGRNVSLREVIAEAYDCNPARVVLPPGAPKGGFDFLVTTPGNARKHLQAAIRKELDYTAHQERRETDVLRLRMTNPVLPGLAVSAGGEKADVTYKNGRLYFQHQQLRVILRGLQEGVNEPVLDETGLTNSYDFSLVWNQKIEQAMHRGVFDLNGVQKVLNGWGLTLEPGTTNLDMVVVEKAR